MKTGFEGDEAEPEAEPETEPEGRTASTDEGPRTIELELGVGLGLALGTCTGITEGADGDGAGVDDEHLSQ